MSDDRPVVLLNSGYKLLKYNLNERLKRIVEQTNVFEPGQGGGRQGGSVNNKMQKNAFCHAWSPQTWKASLSSRHRLQKRLPCNVTGSSLARDEYVSCTRYWLAGADLRQRNSPLGCKRRRKCNNDVWCRCSARKHDVPATVQYLKQGSVANAHSNWAASGDLSWFADWQGPGW